MWERVFKGIYYMDLSEINRRFPLLAAGSSRWVYAVGNDYVVKIATNKDGDDQCRRENYVYKHADTNLREYLCPVLWYAPGMIAMYRAVPFIPLHRVHGDPQIDISRIGRGERAYRDLKSLSKRFKLFYGDILSVTSWGFLGDNLVLVDYGSDK